MNNSDAGSTTFEEFRRSPYFNVLDGLRALAILLVFLHHNPRWPYSWTRPLQENGRYGVSMFFVISGFLICTLFLREEAQTGQIALWKFYARRALRLLPLYYALLAVQTVLVFGPHLYNQDNVELFRSKLPGYLFYFSNWLPTSTQGPFFCAWSLAVEEQFYLLFGVLLVFANRRFVIVAIAMALLVKAVALQLFGPLDTTTSVGRIVFSYQEPILLGVLLAFALNTRRGHEFFGRFFGRRWVLLLLATALTLRLCARPIRSQGTWDIQLLYVIMTLLVAGLVLRKRIPVLAGPTLTYIGKISYGIYLFHMFVLMAVVRLPGARNATVCFLLGGLLTLMAAALSYRFFESPIIQRYKRQLSPLNKPVPEAPLVPLQPALRVAAVTTPASGQ
jgi:peptidoglycan/LPS O-acetylase OafA/YrhL